ncbi:MAG: deoxynucleoside kinase [Bacteroidales bacterium]|nr:deoxynucleoside kinase [Bacteroidales bacterium]
MHIGVAGNIGSGKTTLTRLLSERYGWTPQYESVTFNPYLEDYYKDIPRWSFNLETYFLAQRFHDILEISRNRGTIIQDRTLQEGVNVFVANNYMQGNMSDRDFETYMQLYEVMSSTVHQPDLLIYLRSSVAELVRKIQKRGRDYEQGMSLEYLTGLNNLYEKWISDYTGRLLVVDADALDFEHNPEDLARITDRIDAELYGLFK